MSFYKKQEREEQTGEIATSTFLYNYESDGVTDDYFDDCIGCGCRENFDDTVNNSSLEFCLPIEPSRVHLRDVLIGIEKQSVVNNNHSPQLSVSDIAAAEVRAKIEEFRERAELALMDDSRLSVSDHIHCRNSRCCCEQTSAEQPPKLERTYGDKTHDKRYKDPNRKRSTSPLLIVLTYADEKLGYEQNAQLRPRVNRTPKRQADPQTCLDGRND
ncbi:hypothetical protein BFJ68_g13088 [Fusarium oxysporum]|uniref:Uncharacterized protein n=1 Tax=Fusarium oxysporum TaxID=5507 RepID=A0A420NL42_FUSOX|nr:hypothetical protein BFJ71_g15740 [Fusarium oxysporum]RKK99683.1 hypothetical protein BFJ68_g13088 [Fusarium oxysporum]